VTTTELVFSLLATAVGSPLLVEVFKAFVSWRKGRLSKIAALEAALEEAEQAYDDLKRRKQALRESRREEVTALNDEIGRLKEEILRLRYALVSLGRDPDDNYMI